MQKPTNPQEIINYLRLFRSENVGRTTFFNLLKFFGNSQNAIENIGEYKDKKIKICPLDTAEKEFENCQKIGAKIIIFSDNSYPKLLAEIPDAPPLITFLGDVSLLDKNILAIVGTRNASINGCKFTQNIASDLGKSGFVIASGMARGIDSAAHKASIKTGTIAVIGGGIDNIYPPENEKLYHQIASEGLIISENSFGAKPLASSFPQRNRIISGISLGTIVVESTLKSGTLITARYAIEQNREVFAVPGSPLDPRCAGTNRLIKEGAKLIENALDVLNELSIPQKVLQEEPKEIEVSKDMEIDEIQKLILKNINHCPIAIDELIVNLALSSRLINIAITRLELADKIENKSGRINLKL